MHSRSYAVSKRILDFSAALFGIIVMSPVFLLLALLVKLYGGPGPIIFKQQRVAFQGRVFTIHKFRSMVVGAEQKQKEGIATEKLVTPIGRSIRYCHFDDWPQLFNVLKGDLSLVGLRPRPYAEVQLMKKKQPLWGEREKVKAGMTSLSSVLLYLPEKRERIVALLPKKQRLSGLAQRCNWLGIDLYYVREHNLRMDAIIFYYTILLIFKKIIKLIFKR